MVEVVEKKLCTGCNACKSICPKNAIKMEIDKDGFKYPVIDQEKCINCGLCKKTCPVLQKKENKSLNECYVAYCIDEEERLNSSSGGIFSIIANYILSENGIVIGAAFDENNKLKHYAIDNVKDLEKLKKSKYLQSDLDNIFTYIKDNINDKKILFVGTPCQIGGLKSFIKNNDNLICIDLICHGVPSPKLFQKYIDYLEQENNDKLINYDFRDKSTGWDTYSNKAIFKDKSIKDNKYMKLFLSDVALRESCFNCNFKFGNKYSDITLGDFWKVKDYYPDMYNKKGVSCIIINTQKGKEIFNIIEDKITYKKCKIEEIVSGNPSLVRSCKYNKKRNKFFEDIDKIDFSKLIKKYTKVSLIRKVLRKIKSIKL